MAGPDLGAAGALVRRFDPDLFATALFAAEPGRSRLLTLYAADIELSRAVLAARKPDAGPLIAAMRLQWWHDVADAAAKGTEPPEHDIAGPFADLVSSGIAPLDRLTPLLDAYETEIDGQFTEDGFRQWASGRFGAQLRLAVSTLDVGDPRPMPYSSPLPETAVIGWAMAQASAYALRTAAAMARDGRSVIPDVTPAERSALAERRVTETLAIRVRSLAEEGITALSTARRESRGLPKSWLPAFLPLRLAAPTLTTAIKDPAQALLSPAPINPAIRAVSLSWAALRGRW